MREERGKRARPERGRPKPADDRGLEVRVRIALSLGVMAGFLSAHAGPSNWLWGMNLLRYYPEALGLFWTGAALAAIWLLPAMGARPEAAAVAVAGRRLADESAPATGWTMPLAVAFGAATFSAILFNSFRATSLLLGDSLEIVRRLHQGHVPAPRSALYNVLEPVFFRTFTAGNAQGEGLAAGVLSVVAGTVAVGLATFFLVRLARRDRAGAWAAAALLFLTGALQLFFGYVEVYPLLIAATLVFYAAAFDRITGGGIAGTLVATLAFLFGLTAHPFGITMAPGWLYLVALRRGENGVEPDRRLVTSGLLAALLIVLGLTTIFALKPEWRAPGEAFRYLAPQEYIKGLISGLKVFESRPWANRYRVVSLEHLADFWSTLWLVGAAAVCVILGVVSHREGRRALRRPAALFAIVSLGGILLLRVLFRTPLGAMRDWDLFAGLGLGAAGLATALVLTTNARRLARPIAAASLFFLVPWIGIQISNQRAATRHFDGIEADPRPEPFVASSFHLTMGDRFSNIRQFDLAVRAYERSLAAYPRYEAAWRLGTVHVVTKKYPEAIRAFERAIELQPGDETAMILLAEALMGAGELARAEQTLDRILAANSESGTAHLRKAQIERVLGRAGSAEEHFALADRYLPREGAVRREMEEIRKGGTP